MEKVVCPACGEIFSQSGYTVIVHAFDTQKPTPAAEEEQEAPDVELRKEDEPEVGSIPDTELEEDKQLQSQPLELMGHLINGILNPIRGLPHKNQHLQNFLLNIPLKKNQFNQRLR